ncbi:hypothetical protein DEO72_LG10g1186 [Vigna unguiculata]|uniref:Uncharacterized protein n=1 Tax=Vigna unguiculata TaxID=3917 RepID=A0A4D6N7Y8_VIGUN|nr:hypothetical protein DEO72_LG10g1186 [Vigna unguiculata]
MISKKVALMVLVATMLMTSDGRRVTVLNSGPITKDEIQVEGYAESQQGKENNVKKNDETKQQHCYTKCSSACVNPSTNQVDTLCHNMCKDHCHF